MHYGYASSRPAGAGAISSNYLSSGGGVVLPTIWTADGSARTVNSVVYPATRTFLGSGDWSRIARGGDSSNNDLEGYAAAQVFANGSNQLQIKTDFADITYGSTFHYTSGSIYTPALSFTTGTFELKAQMPDAAWPAWWFLGANCQSTWPTTPDNTGLCQWPNPGSDEIDVIDMFTTNRTNGDLATFMSAGNGSAGGFAYGVDVSLAMHTYTLVRGASSLTSKFDGATKGTLSGSVVPASSMIMILGTAVNAATSSFTTTSMLVDYIAVY
jgi:hypothetical protein